MRGIRAFLGALFFASAATAQEHPLAGYDLPRDVERRLSRIIEDTATRRFTGSARIEASETIVGNVVVFNGPLTLAGRIDGELIVVDGDVDFVDGSAVAGDVTVIGGIARNEDLAQVGGVFTVYSEGFQLYAGGERVLSVGTRRRRAERFREWDYNWGISRITVRTGTNYNRVEGLPIMIGPVIQTAGAAPTRVEALGILRTGSGDVFDADRMGYQLRVEQFIGGRGFRIGGMARSVVQPIEQWNLTDLEASLATFLLHDDQRDYFEREGWGVYARFAPTDFPLEMNVGYYDEDHESRAARDPWTLFGDGNWRSQPLVGEGRLRSVAGHIQYDGRNRHNFASSGFFIRAEATRGIEGSLALPARSVLSSSFEFPRQELNSTFNSGLIDLRVYRRVGVGSALAFRGVAGGSLDGRALPPQFQHALGGAGSMPGYNLFSADCGARRVPSVRASEPNRVYFPGYGCDRFAMGTIEYRGGFEFDFGGDFGGWGRRDDDWDWHIDANPNWMVFFDAGHGWALDASRTRGAVDTGILYDAGAGLLLGDFGIYAAVPLNSDHRGVNVFVRLGSRF